MCNIRPEDRISAEEDKAKNEEHEGMFTELKTAVV